MLGTVVGANAPDRIRLVKGSHIVVDKLFDHDRCYIFQNADGRICFAIPYERDFTLIGTTDEDYRGRSGAAGDQRPPSAIICLPRSSDYFETPVTEEMVRWTYSGVRPLYDDGASRRRKRPATMSETRRRRTEPRRCSRSSAARSRPSASLPRQVMEKLAPFYPTMGAAWTATGELPGGDFPQCETGERIADFSRRHAFLRTCHAKRMFRRLRHARGRHHRRRQIRCTTSVRASAPT